MAERLQDKICLVVGAGQAAGATVGNGRAAAMLFAREGATVLVADRSMESAMATVDLISAEGGKATAHCLDIGDEQRIAHLVSSTLITHGRIDVLHNNVGIGTGAGDQPIESIDSAVFDHIYDLNLRGMALTCKHVLPAMAKRQSGSVVNISSIAARSVHAGVAYKTTKAAVIALTEHIAQRFAPQGVRANCILPGLIETPMAIEALMGGRKREAVTQARHVRVPLRGRMGTGWDIAHAALFLASDEANFITGIAMPVDGGALVEVENR